MPHQGQHLASTMGDIAHFGSFDKFTAGDVDRSMVRGARRESASWTDHAQACLQPALVSPSTHFVFNLITKGLINLIPNPITFLTALTNRITGRLRIASANPRCSRRRTRKSADRAMSKISTMPDITKSLLNMPQTIALRNRRRSAGRYDVICLAQHHR